MGIRILPPDVNRSLAEFAVEGENIRFGLEAIKNVGHGAAMAIVEAREAGSPFTSLQDMCERLDMTRVNAKAIECLIRSGALDSLGLRRSQMMAMLPEVLDVSAALARDRASGQGSLFGAAEDDAALAPTPVAVPDIPEWAEPERLAHEKDLLGTYLTGHPLDRHAQLLAGVDLTSSAEVPQLAGGAKVEMLGLVRTIRPHTTKRGDRMAFLGLEDYQGPFEVVIFPDAYEKFRHLLAVDQALWLRATAQIRDDRRSLIVEEVQTPEAAAKSAVRWYTVDLPCPEQVAPEQREALGRLRGALRGHPGPWRVRLRVRTPEGLLDLATPLAVEPSPALDEEVRLLCAELEGVETPEALTSA